MFELLYRITDKREYLETLNEKSFDEGGDIEGFFAINVNGNYYGHCHYSPLVDDEHGWHLISEWFINFVLVYQNLNRTNYVALNDIESFNMWIEFKKDHDLISVSIVEKNKEDGVTEFQSTPLKDFNYGEWSNWIFQCGEAAFPG